MTKRKEIDEDGYERTIWVNGIAKTMLKDPLSTLTRNNRRNLIFTSAVGIVVALTGIIPEKLLGHALTGTSQSTLIWFLIVAIVYQWITFYIYSTPEKMEYYGKLNKQGYRPDNIGDMPIAAIPASLRNLFDFNFPYLVSLTSVILLLWFVLPSTNNPQDTEWLNVASKILLSLACLSVTIASFASTFEIIVNISKGKYVPENPEDKREQ